MFLLFLFPKITCLKKYWWNHRLTKYLARIYPTTPPHACQMFSIWLFSSSKADYPFLWCLPPHWVLDQHEAADSQSFISVSADLLSSYYVSGTVPEILASINFKWKKFLINAIISVFFLISISS